MSSDRFRAMLLTRDGRSTQVNMRDLTNEDLPGGEVLVAVSHSTLNYKDGLAVTGAGPVIREKDYPIVPGIDLAGEVIESSSDCNICCNKVSHFCCATYRRK